MQPRDIPTFQRTIHKPEHPQTHRIMEYLPKARQLHQNNGRLHIINRPRIIEIR